MRVQPALETTTSNRPIFSIVSFTRFWTDGFEDISAWTRWKRGVASEDGPGMDDSSFMRDCARSEFDE
jgi:hypothetical protein